MEKSITNTVLCIIFAAMIIAALCNKGVATDDGDVYVVANVSCPVITDNETYTLMIYGADKRTGHTIYKTYSLDSKNSTKRRTWILSDNDKVSIRKVRLTNSDETIFSVRCVPHNKNKVVIKFKQSVGEATDQT